MAELEVEVVSLVVTNHIKERCVFRLRSSPVIVSIVNSRAHSFWTYMIGENELQLLTTFAKEFGSSCKNLPFYFEIYLLCI